MRRPDNFHLAIFKEKVALMLVQSFVFGYSSVGLPIPAFQFGSSSKPGASASASPSPKILVVGGVHGDETEGVIAAHGLLDRFAKSFPYDLVLTLVPALNLDGVLAKTRANARGVDLNRNLPSNDWSADVADPRYWPGPSPNSEPESRALVTYLETERPDFILSLHSWKPMLNVNGDCQAEAQAIAACTGYVITESIGYPTPGCLGTYAGLERQMPTLTYEIERGLGASTILAVHVPAILEALKAAEFRSRRRPGA